MKGALNMWGIIATWRMAKEGVEKGSQMLKSDAFIGDAIEEAIKEVEDFHYYKSVGYGGLPNEDMIVELDAAYMNGDDLSFGAVGAIQDFANPISIARSLSKHKVNNFLVGAGAEKYAQRNLFERKNMLVERSQILYKNRLKDMQEHDISPYSGHDTVGMVGLDKNASMVSGTSTSGLFMKHAGRVGDSPVLGSGLYVDSAVGGASATGLGEDLMKGVVSYRVVSLIEQGYHPQEACEIVTFELDDKLIKRRGKAGDISIIAMDKNGRWGAASNIDSFSFVVATENEEPCVYTTVRKGDKMVHEPASQEWLDEYMRLEKEEAILK